MIKRDEGNTVITAQRAGDAGKKLRRLSTAQKNKAIEAIKKTLQDHAEDIFEANRRDLERSSNLSSALIKRLKFQQEKLNETLAGIDALLKLPDPVGEVLESRELSPGMNLYRVRCPIGVIAMIFESRPDAAIQIASLALKSGNSILLKGGHEAQETLRILTNIIHDAAVSVSVPEGWLGNLETRQHVSELLKMDNLIDLIIPRGSNDFVRHIMNNSHIPVLGHADGICHLFVDDDASLDMAIDLVIDSKVQYAAVCNALETLLIHGKVAQDFLPKLALRLEEKSVTIRGCPRSCTILSDIFQASTEDWSTEYLDTILAVKIVDSLQDAIDHINRYGSGHTDGIIGQNIEHVRDFMDGVDTANALWNCSTRFSDGFRYGLGAEVGVSTGKIHARGPVGMEGLTSYQWRLIGTGNRVSDFPEGKGFTHKKISPEYYPFL